MTQTLAAGASPGIIAGLKRRWPTWLAIALTALIALDAQHPIGLATGLLLMPLIYLATAVLQRPPAVWIVFPVLTVVLYALQLQNWVHPWLVLLVAAVALSVWGTLRGHYRSGVFVVQVLGMLCFGALAFAALYVDPDLGRYVVAAGWFAHGIWDIAHHRADKAVARSYAESCAVMDILVAAVILFLPLPLIS